MGIEPPSVGSTDLTTLPAHIQAAIIAQSSIIFESVYNEEIPGQIDKIILLEGPFVAGTNNEASTVNIELRRNLGVWNSQYPAALVRLNNIFINKLKDIAEITESTVIWQVSP